jgi:endoglucanase
VLGYDLLNEPIPPFEGYEQYNPLLEPLYRRLADAVREVDPNHVLFLGGAQWDTNFRVFGAPFAGNLAYTFHKYWMEPVQGAIQEYLDFREQYSVPIWMGESGENKDEWIAAFRQLLEDHGIGWCFWPYKRMDATSCVRTFDPPPYWDEIVAYGQARPLDPVHFKELRPPLAHSRAALAGLLENIRFEQTRENGGYVAALGL